MKNNNKGFTLIELLAVVVILLVISVIAISSISAAIERNKNKQNQSKYNAIESVAKGYYIANKNYLEKNNKTQIPLNDLDLSDSEITDADGNIICGYVEISRNAGKVEFQFVKSNC